VERPPTWTDEELLAQFQGGQRDAFGDLVRRYEGELYGYLRRYLGDGELAADVFQNTFLLVFTRAHQFEAGRPVRPWLYAIATNQAIDAMRRQGRHQAVRLDDATDATEGDDGSQLARYLQSDEPGPLDQLDGAERRQFVRDSVGKLPDFLRHVVLLTFYQGLKQSEIGSVLGIPVGTVKSRMHTALARLLEMWEEHAAVKET
jgi:RNA polymerase sigma-70 factor (ECF subfamily)